MTGTPTTKTLGLLVTMAMLASACSTTGTGSAGLIVVDPMSDPPPVIASDPVATLEPTDEPTNEPTNEPSSTQQPDDPTPATPDATPEPETPTPSEHSAAAEPDALEPVRAVTIHVFWLDADGNAVAAQRVVQTRETASAAIRALIEGPSASEAAAGLSSAFPDDTLLLGITIADGTARVNLSREFEAGGGSAAILGRLAQLVFTLTSFQSVERVQLLLDGQAITTFSGEGVDIGDSMTRADLLGAIRVEPAPADVAAPVWGQSELPVVTIGGQDIYRVVLVAGDDVLNVRSRPEARARIIGKLVPGVAIEVTGETRRVGASTWLEVSTPAGTGWANGRYLTRSVAEGVFPDGDPVEVVNELARRFEAGEDVSSLVSSTGLWVAHHAAPVHISREELPGILADPSTRRWGSNALEDDSPEIQPRTFAQAVADPFVDTWEDDDTRILAMQTVEGPNGRPGDRAIPTEFQGMPYVTVHDPGDDPQYGGLDWMQWIVSLAWEDDEVKVVGLTFDNWAP